ncbi:MAG: PorT family protein [Cyclobacteriaceae bacterium]|nr:PorT family protein [Cyclobacteriaceae bacterium]MDX5467455.1 PorT family protein [Cyclobacteriaceae bacterium]
MKKIILAILPLFLISLTAFGQLEKGTILLGGGLGYSSTSSQSEEDVAVAREFTNSAFNISPEVGYFFKPKWVLGLSLPISGSNQKTTSVSSSGSETLQNESNSNSIGIAPFVRKYISMSEVFSFFLQARMGYYQSRSEFTNFSASPNTSTNTQSKEFAFDATAGMAYFPKKWLGINLSVSPLSYSSGSSQLENGQSSLDQKSSGFSLGLDTSAITLGVNFFLTKK